MSSTVADHCRAYALSSPDDSDFQEKCDHDHDDVCDRCNQLSSVMNDIEKAVEEAECTSATRKELSFVVKEAKKNIISWKSHLLRSVNQDRRRLDVLQKLDSSSVLLVLDWAMKYEPRKFRESQSEWFGKRGIPWHITVATRRGSDGGLETMTLVHVFESVTQDRHAVLAILDDVLKQLKVAMPELQLVYLKQDNAGCYHCVLTIIAARYVATRNGIALESMDFSDPQGGKGCCDRKAALIKSHMSVYLNSGHDIETAEQMQEAIESSNGLPGVNVYLCSMTSETNSQPTWDGVSFISNIQYSESGVKVWRAYGIGKGKSLPWSTFDFTDEDVLPSLTSSTNKPTAGFVPIKPKRERRPTSSKSSENVETDDSEDDSSVAAQLPSSEGSLFSCPEEGCVKTYRRYSSLQKHLDCAEHERALEFETLYDRAILGYASKLEHADSDIPRLQENFNTEVNACPPPSKGWALKSSNSKRKRFSDKQKNYLLAKFQLGERTGRKCNPTVVSKEMRIAKDDNGELLFDSSEFLTSKQIAGVFSRLAAKRSDLIANDEDDNVLEENEREKELRELKTEIMSEISSSHPIVYDTYDICDLVTNKKMLKFSINMLQEICTSLGLDTAGIQTRRKKPYIELLENLVNDCECQR